MSGALVTVIVPVYNLENYIDRCVESLIKQTYANLEILLIDDGSIDHSGSKCDAWAQTDARITVYHKENGGLSHARNYALDRTHGQYTLFLDSDDYLELSAVASLVSDAVALDAEIVVGNERCIKPLDEKQRLSDVLPCHTVITGKEYLHSSLTHNMYKVSVWRMLFKTEFLQKNHLYFMDGFYFEDDIFTPQAFLLAERVVLIKDLFLVHDNTRSDSIVRSMDDSEKKGTDRVKIVEHMAKVYQSVTPKKLKNELLNTLSWKFLAAYRRYGKAASAMFMKHRLAPLKYARRPAHILQSLVFVISPAVYMKLSKKHLV